MNKPKMSLALSALVALSAASQAAQAKAPSSAIWQKMAGVNEAPVQKKSVKAAKKSVKSSRKAQPVTVASKPNTLDQSHAMLFIPGFGKDKAGALSTDNAPAAALSIHPSLPANIDLAPAASSDSSYSESNSYGSQRTMSEIPTSEDVSVLKAPDGILDGVKTSNDISALPDNLLAQAETGDITATPIPPVVTGTVELEEFKPTNIIDVAVSKSRTFKMRNKIVRTSISDPGVVEPVVISENQLVLLGKSPGRATMVLWDDAGNSSAIDVRVTRDYTQLQSTLREIDPRIIVKTYSVGGSDRVVLLGDVDHPESVIRGFAASNVYMDDRGMNIQVANNRLINARIGEVGATGGGGGGGGGQSGQLAQLNSVDTYTFFPNINNNVSLAQAITSDGGRVTSLIKIRKVPLIAMHVTFMEMNTSAARSLAVSMGVGFTGYGFNFAVGGSNSGNGGTYLASNPGFYQRVNTFTGVAPAGPTGTVPFAGSAQPVTFLNPTNLGIVNAVGQPIFASAPPILAQQVLLGAPGGAGFGIPGLGNLFTAISNISPNNAFRLSFNPSVQGIIANNRARILAEPTIVCISGERASFLAGGEIPIVQTVATAGTAQISITYEPFGMRINFIPVLMENGSLNIEISPEERILSNTFAFNFPGSATSISGFTTRKTQTMVEMKPGQELFLSGLITNNSGRELSKYPILGEVPVIGALYRSKAFNKNESELVVAIRPEIILPGTPGQLKLPEDIGRVEGPRDMNMFQVEPTVIDERHYSSGRAERHQKTSPTLPEGAPIPDNR